MIKRKAIYDAHRRRGGLPDRHSRNSANILSRISRQLDEYPIPYKLDYRWPYHLIVHINNRRLSVYAGGWSNLTAILPIKKDGHPYNSKYEKSFLTPIGVVNYILRKFGS